jgi:hypothetical protein
MAIAPSLIVEYAELGMLSGYQAHSGVTLSSEATTQIIESLFDRNVLLTYDPHRSSGTCAKLSDFGKSNQNYEVPPLTESRSQARR